MITDNNNIAHFTEHQTSVGIEMKLTSADVSEVVVAYANDAAADADSALLSGAFYKITGLRAIFQKP